MFDCPSCGQTVRQLIIPDQGKLGCRGCIARKPKPYNVNLCQTYAKDDKTRLTWGKAREIELRMQSPEDPRIMINRETGKETQY